MCFDQEKTQGVDSSREFMRAEKALRDQQREERLKESAGMIGRAMSESEILAELFSYHPPNPITLPKFGAINQAAKNFAEVVLQNCPPCADRSVVIRLIRDARMTANASVALDGLSL